jgi:hypothetical protein
VVRYRMTHLESCESPADFCCTNCDNQPFCTNCWNKRHNNPGRAGHLKTSDTGIRFEELLRDQKVLFETCDVTGDLFRASFFGNAGLIASLLKNGADPSAQNKSGNTPIHLTCDLGDSQVVKDCLKVFMDPNITTKKVELNMKNGKGKTALHISAGHGDLDATRILLQNKADPNIQDNDGNTALHIITINAPPNAEAIMETLIEFKGDYDIPNGNGMVPFQFNTLKFSKTITKIKMLKTNCMTGDVEVALSWFNKHDLDLHVVCPCGHEIFYNSKKCNNCGGTLDVDMNAGGQSSLNPVEHVNWQIPKSGWYTVFVKYFSNKDNKNEESDYHVCLIKKGQGVVMEKQGKVSTGLKVEAFRFQI